MKSQFPFALRQRQLTADEDVLGLPKSARTPLSEAVCSRRYWTGGGAGEEKSESVITEYTEYG